MRNSLSNEQVSENILAIYYKDDTEKRTIKKELKLSIGLKFDDTRYGSVIIPQIKIGYDKLYSLNNKIYKFYDVYEGSDIELSFGKNFVYNKTAIDIVNRELTNNDISCYVIDGSVSVKKRIELVDNFNNDNTNVFLITLKADGTGLNLISADVVIHLDLWWNPQVEHQATDRVHRIG